MAVHLDVILGVLGNITAICLFTSPIPTFWNIAKKKSVQDFSGVPYVCTLLNCTLWVIYGSPLVGYQLLVITINGAGVVLEVFYILVYFTFAPKQHLKMKALKLLLAMVVVFISLLVLALELVHDKSRRKIIAGTFGVIVAMGMYSSPLTIMCMVIKTRSVEFMPFFLSLFIFLNSVVWFGYAFAGKIDIFLAVPNGFGALAGIAQLVLYAIYKNATPSPLVLKQQEVAAPVVDTVEVDLKDPIKPPKQITTLEQHEVRSLKDNCMVNNSSLVVVDIHLDLVHQENNGKTTLDDHSVNP